MITPETESIPDEEVVEPVVETIQVEEEEVSPPPEEEVPELEPELTTDTVLPEDVPEPLAEEKQPEVLEEIESPPEAIEEEAVAVEGTSYAGVEKEAESFEPQLENDSPELPQGIDLFDK